MRDDTLPPLREVIRAHGLSAEKSLGQNFLLDLNLTRRIARVAAPLEGFQVLEIGPGPGGLTRGLLTEGADSVTAIERDRRCAPILAEISDSFGGVLKLHEADALTVDEKALLPPNKPVKIVANLPYNIGTQLFLKWVAVEKWPSFFSSLSLMFQREVADRIVASPGSKAYGRLSVLAQWRGIAKIALKVPAAAFTPPPKVDSAVIHFVPKITDDDRLPIKVLEATTTAAFSMRRKMLRASLKSLVKDPVSLLEQVELDPTARAEDISVADYGRLARAYYDRFASDRSI